MSFPPHVVRTYLSRFDIQGNDLVLDPFCGTGTTLVECKKRGVPSCGIESNPIAHFATEVKLDWSPDSARLTEQSRAIARETCMQVAEGESLHSNLRGLPSASGSLLLANSISPVPLHKILVLLDTIGDASDENLINHYRLAVAKVLVSGAGNLRFRP